MSDGTHFIEIDGPFLCSHLLKEQMVPSKTPYKRANLSKLGLPPKTNHPETFYHLVSNCDKDFNI